MRRGLLSPSQRRVRTNAGIDDCRRLWTTGSSTANRMPRAPGLLRILVRYKTLTRNFVRLPYAARSGLPLVLAHQSFVIDRRLSLRIKKTGSFAAQAPTIQI